MGLPILVALVLGACTSHTVRYYANDGPPEHVPPDLASIPDAVPRIEPVNPYANRPYSAMGRKYSPDTSDEPFEQRGLASWYGRQYHGNRTASGEPYDMFAMSAAHPTLPIPSYARVTNARDHRSIVVRINDRGPFVQDRVIDLSYAAAVRLGIANLGSGEVIVQKLTSRDINEAAKAAPVLAAVAPVPPAVDTAPPPANQPAAAAAGPTSAAVPALPPPGLAPSGAPSPPQEAPQEVRAQAALAPVAPPALEPIAPVEAPPASVPEAPIAEVPDPAPGWSVQLGAFSVLTNASELRDQLARRLSEPDAGALPAQARSVRIEHTGRLNRVLIGRLADRRSAQTLAWQLGKLLARETSLYGR
jgi:rare lipoprotein A